MKKLFVFAALFGAFFVLSANLSVHDHLLLLDGAKVYKNEWIVPGGFDAPGTKAATLVDQGIDMAWEFTDSTDDTICATVRLPQDMDRTAAMELKIGWNSDTVDPGDDTKQVVWQLEYVFRAVGEDMTAAAQETLETTTSASTVTNGLVISTITGIDLPSATDNLIKLRIKRLGADGDDDLGDVAYITGCGLKYTIDKLGASI